MTSVLKALPGYSKKQGRFRPWLTGIMRHRLADAYRRRRKEPLAEDLEIPVHNQVTDSDPLGAWIDEEWGCFMVRWALGRLRNRRNGPIAPDMRRILELRYARKWDVDQVVRVLGCPRQDIYNAEFRWGRLLKEEILAGTRKWEKWQDSGLEQTHESDI